MASHVLLIAAAAAVWILLCDVPLPCHPALQSTHYVLKPLWTMTQIDLFSFNFGWGIFCPSNENSKKDTQGTVSAAPSTREIRNGARARCQKPEAKTKSSHTSLLPAPYTVVCKGFRSCVLGWRQRDMSNYFRLYPLHWVPPYFQIFSLCSLALGEHFCHAMEFYFQPRLSRYLLFLNYLWDLHWLSLGLSLFS